MRGRNPKVGIPIAAAIGVTRMHGRLFDPRPKARYSVESGPEAFTVQSLTRPFTGQARTLGGARSPIQPNREPRPSKPASSSSSSSSSASAGASEDEAAAAGAFGAILLSW